MRELIYKDEAYKAIDNCIRDGWDRISPSEAKMNIQHLVSDVNEADRPQKVIAQITFDEEKLREIVKEAVERLKEEYEIVDRPQGEWIGYDVPSECSVCGHCWDEYVFGPEIWYDGSVPNYCPHCGAQMKGVDDE